MATPPDELPRASRPVPPSLAKHGIKRVIDNLLPGQEVNFVKPLFMHFRPDLEARFVKPAPKPKKKGGGDGDPTL